MMILQELLLTLLQGSTGNFNALDGISYLPLHGIGSDDVCAEDLKETILLFEYQDLSIKRLLEFWNAVLEQ